jgi:hypothetical protein
MDDLIRITKKIEELERKQLEVRRNLKKFRELKRRWENVVAMRRQLEIAEKEKEKEKPVVAFNTNPFAGYTGGIFGVATKPVSFKPVSFADLNFTFNQPEAKRQRTD